jgi:protein TonB
MHLLANGLMFLIRFCVVLLINFSLFLIIPVSQNIFSLFIDENKSEAPQRKVVAELVKPPKQKEQQEKKSHIRNVATSSARSMQDPMKFKIAPDLSIAGSGEGAVIASEEMHAEVFEEGEVDEPATPVFQPKPGFPEKARKLAIEGEVALTFIVGVDGKVASIESISSPHSSFNMEIRKALEEWKFKPALKKGVPVSSKMSIIMDFGLDT